MKIIGMLAICLALTASPAFAGNYGGVEEGYLYFAPQYFSWEEFSGGRRLLIEEGALFGVGGGARLDLHRKKLMLKVQGEVFGGDVNYRGQTQQDFLPSPPNPPHTPSSLSERPVKTSVVYFGMKLETDIGWRMQLADGSVEPFAGVGYRWWLRSLQNSTTVDANGNVVPVGGYTELWQTLYTRLGMRGSYAVSKDTTFFAEAGGKYPFLNRNSSDFPGAGNITLEPDPRWSMFAEIGARYGKFRTALFYEGFRFGQSPLVPISGTVALLQPKTDSDIFGVSIGWCFK
jgi:hypothetical protein